MVETIRLRLLMNSYGRSWRQATVVVALSVVVAGAPHLHAEDIQWGTAVSGLRLGVSIAQGGSGRELHVIFRNDSPWQLHLLIAQQGGGPPVIGYDFDVRAVSPDGKADDRLGYWISGDLGVLVPIGLVTPYVAALPPGRMYRVSMPIRIFFRFQAGGQLGLEERLRQGYKVRVSYAIPAGNRTITKVIDRYPDLWAGEITSGEAGTQ